MKLSSILLLVASPLAAECFLLPVKQQQPKRMSPLAEVKASSWSDDRKNNNSKGQARNEIAAKPIDQIRSTLWRMDDWIQRGVETLSTKFSEVPVRVPVFKDGTWQEEEFRLLPHQVKPEAVAAKEKEEEASPVIGQSPPVVVEEEKIQEERSEEEGDRSLVSNPVADRLQQQQHQEDEGLEKEPESSMTDFLNSQVPDAEITCDEEREEVVVPQDVYEDVNDGADAVSSTPSSPLSTEPSPSADKPNIIQKLFHTGRWSDDSKGRRRGKADSDAAVPPQKDLLVAEKGSIVDSPMLLEEEAARQVEALSRSRDMIDWTIDEQPLASSFVANQTPNDVEERANNNKDEATLVSFHDDKAVESAIRDDVGVAIDEVSNAINQGVTEAEENINNVVKEGVIRDDVGIVDELSNAINQGVKEAEENINNVVKAVDGKVDEFIAEMRQEEVGSVPHQAAATEDQKKEGRYEDAAPVPLVNDTKLSTMDDYRLATGTPTIPSPSTPQSEDDDAANLIDKGKVTLEAFTQGKAAAPKKEVIPEQVSPMYASFLTGDGLPPRKSVDDILRESKMAAVEEWHRSKTEEKELSLDEKVGLVEGRLAAEIYSGSSEQTMMEYVNVLEKIGEQQKALTVVPPITGRWDLAYSSIPKYAFLSLPKWLGRFLISFSANVNIDGKSVIYRTVFRFLKWFPVLRRSQPASLQVMSPSSRKTVEVLGQPRFSLGRLFSWALPRPRTRHPLRLVNNITYLGSRLKICRVSRPTVSSETSLAVFLRNSPSPSAYELTEEEEEEKIVAIDKLFRRKNRQQQVRFA